jgi:hypothetical protein
MHIMAIQPSFETITTFPIVPDANRGRERLRVAQLQPVFRDIGQIALSSLEDPDAAGHGEDVFTFLAGATAFMGELPIGRTQLDEVFYPGRHTYARDLSDDIGAGLRAARREVKISDYPLGRIVLAYTVGRQYGKPPPISAVSVAMLADGDPAMRASYARLAVSINNDWTAYTMRVAVGTITHDGVPEPDLCSSFDILAAIGDKIAQFPGAIHRHD